MAGCRTLANRSLSHEILSCQTGQTRSIIILVMVLVISCHCIHREHQQPLFSKDPPDPLRTMPLGNSAPGVHLERQAASAAASRSLKTARLEPNVGVSEVGPMVPTSSTTSNL